MKITCASLFFALYIALSNQASTILQSVTSQTSNASLVVTARRMSTASTNEQTESKEGKFYINGEVIFLNVARYRIHATDRTNMLCD